MGGGFHGAAVITLDAKGRVAIPTRHRDALLDGGKSLVVTAHPDGCVLIYPANEWEPVRLRVEAFPSFHPQASWWKRLLLGFEEHLTRSEERRVGKECRSRWLAYREKKKGGCRSAVQ